ncbi:MAG: hypothetical protein AAGH92_09360 [Planctomycetota bacterium]
MSDYRRARIDGGWYFFTLYLRDRRQTLLVDRIETLRRATASTKQRFSFRIHAWLRRNVIPADWSADSRVRGMDIEA